MTIPSSPVVPSRSQRLRRVVRQVHRWLGLLVGIQVLFWVGGGLIMSALQLDAVRGEHQVARQEKPVLDASDALLPLGPILQSRGDIRSVTLTTFLARPVYRVEAGAAVALVDARTGEALSPLSEANARAVAAADYAGDGALASLEWVDEPAMEYRGRDLPLWRARFDDARDTTLYLSPQTGQVVARRNDLWRVFDFVWMLHIMDYEERDDFNHPLLIATAATALLFVFSGLTMLFFSFRPSRS